MRKSFFGTHTGISSCNQEDKIVRILNLFLLISLFWSCNRNKEPRASAEQVSEPILWGLIEVADLQADPYGSWYRPGYAAYQPDTTALRPLKGQLDGITITVFLGTWCEDSHREVPRFQRILDYLELSDEQVTYICLNRQKVGPNSEEMDYDIQNVPTMIVNLQGTEIGRIVETPEFTLEQDLIEIISGNRDY